jgi:L-alanine-DL-glutamate epimerase-like enolase superfamily enzyme
MSQAPVLLGEVTSFVARLPLRHPLDMGGLRLTYALNLFVRIEALDGACGWGEAASAPTMTGETAPGMLAGGRGLASRLVGRRFDGTESLLSAMNDSLVGNAAAKSAIEMAYLDLCGRVRGVPVHALLGERRRSKLDLQWLLASGDADADVTQARLKQREGWSKFKVKVGMQTAFADAQRVLAVVDALGPHASVCADANCGYSVEEAVSFLHAVEGSGLAFLEQPIRGSDTSQWKAMSSRSSTPIGIDESLASLEDAERFQQAGSVSGGSFKAIKFGGLTRMLDAAERSCARGFRINLAGKVAESSIAAAALVHAGAVLSKVDWGLSLTNGYLSTDVVTADLNIADGAVLVPDEAGLGITVDAQCLRDLRVTDASLFSV